MSTTVENVVSRILVEGAINLRRLQKEAEKAGINYDKTTYYRWCLYGCGGVKLEHIRVGNEIITSLPALTRFIHARTAKKARA